MMIPRYLAHLEQMAGRPWTDLVCTDDYFGPVGGMMRKSPLPEGATEGAFVRSLTPHIFHAGDSITRCMMQRIRSRVEFLGESRSVVREAVCATARPYEKQIAAERTAWEKLCEGRSELQRLCLTEPDARMREACITVVQVPLSFILIQISAGWACRTPRYVDSKGISNTTSSRRASWRHWSASLGLSHGTSSRQEGDGAA